MHVTGYKHQDGPEMDTIEWKTKKVYTANNLKQNVEPSLII